MNLFFSVTTPPIIDGDGDFLLRPKVPFRGLNRRVPQREFDLLQVAAFLQSFAHVRRRPWGPKSFIPIAWAHFSTTAQTDQSPRAVSPILPDFEIGRSRGPLFDAGGGGPNCSLRNYLGSGSFLVKTAGTEEKGNIAAKADRPDARFSPYLPARSWG
jgi:hypothetical protein